jgi:predicted esterase
VALGGDVPPELVGRELSSRPRVLIGRGLADEWYSEEKLESDLEILRSLSCKVDVVRFSGGHEWTDEFRSRCQVFLDSLASVG